MSHRNAPLSPEGQRRLVQRCQNRLIAHVAAEMGIPRACASKWVNRYRRHGELGLLERSSTPQHQPTATDADIVAKIEAVRRTKKWSASRMAFELQAEGIPLSRRTVSRHLLAPGQKRRRFIDPRGDTNREPRRITARRPGHMVHIDVKKVGRIPDGGGWRSTDAEAPRPRPSSAARTRAHAAATSPFTPPSTDSADSPTPKRCPTRKPPPPSRSCTGQGPGSQPTASPASNASSRTTELAAAQTRSPGPCSAHATSASRRTRPATTARWSATTGSSPKSSSRPAAGSPKTNAATPSASGTSTATTTGPMVQ